MRKQFRKSKDKVTGWVRSRSVSPMPKRSGFPDSGSQLSYMPETTTLESPSTERSALVNQPLFGESTLQPEIISDRTIPAIVLPVSTTLHSANRNSTLILPNTITDHSRVYTNSAKHYEFKDSNIYGGVTIYNSR